jgi:hypothetical protein
MSFEKEISNIICDKKMSPALKGAKISALKKKEIRDFVLTGIREELEKSDRMTDASVRGINSIVKVILGRGVDERTIIQMFADSERDASSKSVLFKEGVEDYIGNQALKSLKKSVRKYRMNLIKIHESVKKKAYK